MFRHYVVPATQLSILVNHDQRDSATAGVSPAILRDASLHRRRAPRRGRTARRAAVHPCEREPAAAHYTRKKLTCAPAGSSPVAARNEHERVGGRGPRDHVRLLAGDGLEQRTGVTLFDACAHELVPIRAPPQPDASVPGSNRGRGAAVPCNAQQRRAHEELERDERRDRVSGQPEDERRAAHRECDRLARLHRNAPEHLVGAELRERLAHEVVRADRDTARREEHVRGERTLERVARLDGIVGDRR